MRLLDSYEAERMPVARRLLITTDRAFALVVSDSGGPDYFRTRVLAARRLCDDPRQDTNACISHHFADRHSLSG